VNIGAPSPRLSQQWPVFGPFLNSYFFALPPRLAGLDFVFALVFPSFISSCGLGGICPNAAKRRLVSSILYLGVFVMIEDIRDPRFQMARGLAIEAYTNVERSLAYVFHHFLEAPLDRSNIVFFRIINSRSRIAILSDLLNKKYRSKFDLYWHGQPGTNDEKRLPGLFTFIQHLDDRRNEIVHWHTVFEYGRDESTGRPANREELRPHLYWSKDIKGAWITKERLREFSAKAEFVGDSIWMFYRVMAKDNVNEADIPTWLQIFQQPPLYPPLDTHPLSPNYKIL
jgi:hypothetical protein